MLQSLTPSLFDSTPPKPLHVENKTTKIGEFCQEYKGRCTEYMLLPLFYSETFLNKNFHAHRYLSDALWYALLSKHMISSNKYVSKIYRFCRQNNTNRFLLMQPGVHSTR